MWRLTDSLIPAVSGVWWLGEVVRHWACHPWSIGWLYSICVSVLLLGFPKFLTVFPSCLYAAPELLCMGKSCLAY